MGWFRPSRKIQPPAGVGLPSENMIASAPESDPLPSHWLIRHFARYHSLRPWPFCWRVTAEFLVLGLIASTALSFISNSGMPTLTSMPFFLAVALVVVIAPLWETLVFQWLPIAVARRYHARYWLQISLSTALFAVAHYLSRGLDAGMVAGLIGGFYLSFCFATWWPRSGWTALWTTGLSHALSNAVLIGLLAVVSGGWPGPAHDLTMDSGVGGPAGLASWYFWKPHGPFEFAIVSSYGTLHSLSSDDLWASLMVNGVSSPFQMQIGSTYYQVSYDLRGHTLTVGGHVFDLRKADAIYVRVRGGRLTFDPRLVKLNSALFRSDPYQYPFAVLTATFATYAEPPYVSSARRAVRDYLQAERRRSQEVGWPTR